MALLGKHRYNSRLEMTLVDKDFGDLDSMITHLRRREDVLRREQARQPKNVQSNSTSGPKSKKKICFEFQRRGKCSRKNCRFAHDRQSTKKPCWNFQKLGTCRFGKKCIFSHDAEHKTTSANGAEGMPPSREKEEKHAPEPKQHSDKKLGDQEEIEVGTSAVGSKKPYDLDPSLRSRRKVILYAEGANEISKILALVDEGSQPTTVSRYVVDTLRSRGVPVRLSPCQGSITAFNTGKSKVKEEAEFEVKAKIQNHTKKYITLKIYALVVEGPTNQDFVLGIDMQNLYCINAVKSPDPSKRLVKISGQPVVSVPCSVRNMNLNLLGLDTVMQEDTISHGELLSICTSRISPEHSDSNEGALQNDLSPMELIDLPDQNMAKAVKPFHDATDNECRSELGKIVDLDPFGDQNEPNDRILGGPALRIVNRIEEQMDNKQNMLNSKAEFYYVRAVISRFRNVFVDALAKCGTYKCKPCDIRPWLKPGIKPIRCKPYYLPPDKVKSMKLAMQKLESEGVFFKIHDNKVKWSSPAFPVWDKGKKLPRIVVAMGRLNDACLLQYSVQPITEVTLMRILNSRYCTYSDAKGGYRQIPTTEFTMLVFVMVTLWAAYGSYSIPMGYKNAPQIFCEVMADFTSTLKDTYAHMDDIMNCGTTFLSAMLEFAKYLERAEQKNLKLSAKKLQLFPKKARVLGLIKTENECFPDPDRYKAVDELEPPIPGRKFKKGVKRILGLFVYYMKFIKDFWKWAAPINDLTKDGAKQEWTERHQSALEVLKHELKSSSLAIPKFSLISKKSPWILDSDASNAIGAGTLSQVIDGVEHLVCCHSFVFSSSQRNWHIIRKEMYTPIRLLSKFAMFVVGFPILIRMDARCAIWMAKNGERELREPWTRMSVAYNSYSITEIQYREGSKHANADAFSRSGADSKNPGNVLKDLFPLHFKAAQSKAMIRDSPACALCEDVHIQPWNEVAIITLEEDPVQIAEQECKISSDILGDNLAERMERDYKKLFDAMSSPKNPNHNLVRSQYVVDEDGLLYKKSIQTLDSKEKLLICIPEEERELILDSFHNTPTGAHRNSKDLAAKIKQSYYWPGLDKQARAYVKTCGVCNRVKNKITLMPMASARTLGIMDRISLDCVGEIAAGAYSYMITCCILSVRYLIVRVVKRINAKETAKFLYEEVITKFGVPKQILTDSGTEFLNSVMGHLANLLKFHHLRISVGNSQGNSLLERKHRAINEGVLAMLAQTGSKPSVWHTHIPAIVFSINTLIDSKGHSPAMLLFGYQPRQPGDVSRIVVPDIKDKKMRTEAERIQDRIQSISDARDLHRTLLEEMKFWNIFRANSKIKRKIEDDYAVGDIVWLYRKQSRSENKVTGKFDYKKTGPVTILSKNEKSDTYRVSDPKTGYTATIHAKYLTPHGRFIPTPPDEEVDDNESSGSSDSEEIEEPTPIPEGRPRRNRRVPDFGPVISH